MKTTIQIDRLALEGDGIGRLSAGKESGQAAFVPYTLPGDFVAARLLTQKKHHSRWLPVEVQKPGNGRIEPPCPYHFKTGAQGPWCGGCDWQHIASSRQGDLKQQLVSETLERLGGFKSPPVHQTMASPAEWRYRNKVQVPISGQKGNLKAGFFAPDSHVVVPFSDCLVQPELSVKILHEVKAFANRAGWLPYDEDLHRGWLRHILIRMNEKQEALLALVTMDSAFPQKKEFIDHLKKTFPSLVGVHQNIQTARTHVILGERWIKLWGQDRLGENMLGLSLSYSPGSFFQINTKAAQKLYNLALERLGLESKEVVLDLYCGVGALTLAAAKKTKFALGVEIAGSSIRDAKFNALQNKIANVEFVKGNVETVLNHEASPWADRLSGERLYALLDPPRAGVSAQVIQSLVRLKPARIVYISCHPATLARDLKLLSSQYHLVSVTPVDLFPQTSHIESVAQLDLST